MWDSLKKFIGYILYNRIKNLNTFFLNIDYQKSVKNFSMQSMNLLDHY